MNSDGAELCFLNKGILSSFVKGYTASDMYVSLDGKKQVHHSAGSTMLGLQSNHRLCQCPFSMLAPTKDRPRAESVLTSVFR